MNYAIYSSRTGELLIPCIELDETEIESLSSDNAEGHFRAGALAHDELITSGLSADASVYALVK